MVDRENSSGNYKTLIRTIWAIKNPEMVKFIPEGFKHKHMCKNAIKKLLFAIMYVSDQYKTQ